MAVNALDFLIGEWTKENDDSLQSTTAQIGTNGKTAQRTIPDTIRALARMVEEQYGVPSGVTISQFILESQWGKKDLGVNNVFGHTLAAVKQYMTTPRSVVRRELIHRNGMNVSGKPTSFAAYNNLRDAFETHGRYLSGSRLYKAAFAYKSQPEMFAKIIAIHYATDTDYALKLITIIRRYKL